MKHLFANYYWSWKRRKQRVYRGGDRYFDGNELVADTRWTYWRVVGPIFRKTIP